MKAFSKIKKTGKNEASDKTKIIDLKEELLMLAALENNKDEEAHNERTDKDEEARHNNTVIDLCESIDIENAESVEEFIEQARQDPNMMDADTLVAVTSIDDEDADGFEVMNVTNLGMAKSWFVEEAAEVASRVAPQPTEPSTDEVVALTRGIMATNSKRSQDVKAQDAIFTVAEHPYKVSNSAQSSSSVVSGGSGNTKSPKLSTIATSLVSTQAQLITTRAKTRSETVQLKSITRKIEMETKNQELRKIRAEGKAMEEAKKEEARRHRAKLAAMVAANKEEKKRRAAKAAAMELAKKNQVRLEKEMAKQRAREQMEAAKLEKEEQMELERAQKKKEAATQAKLQAVRDLELALERVEKARDVERAVEEDPEFEIDDETVCSKRSTFSLSSRRSAGSFRSLGKKLKKNGSLARGRSKGKKNMGTVSMVMEEERGDGNTAVLSSLMDIQEDEDSQVSEEARDDTIAPKRSGSLLTKRSGSLLKDVVESDEVSFLKSKLEQLHDQLGGLADDMIEREEDSVREGLFSFNGDSTTNGDSKVDDASEYSYADDNKRPDTVEGWLEWFMGDPEGGHCGSICSSVNSYEDYHEKSYSKRMRRNMKSRMKSRRAM